MTLAHPMSRAELTTTAQFKDINFYKFSFRGKNLPYSQAPAALLVTKTEAVVTRSSVVSASARRRFDLPESPRLRTTRGVLRGLSAPRRDRRGGFGGRVIETSQDSACVVVADGDSNEPIVAELRREAGLDASRLPRVEKVEDIDEQNTIRSEPDGGLRCAALGHAWLDCEPRAT